MKRRILVIEDDRDIAHLLELNLRDVCDEVVLRDDGVQGLAAARAQRFNLIVLDLRLPGLEGLELCRLLRAERDYTPILMLTAKSSETDRVVGLELGADDYLTKPFSIVELLARVKAILRRAETFQHAPSAPVLHCGDLCISREKRQVTLAGHRVDLTAKEFDLLLHFARNPGRVYSRAQLLDAVWGYGHEGYEHTVNSHINRLRAKIENDPAHPRHILTVWGVGYKFSEVDDEPTAP